MIWTIFALEGYYAKVRLYDVKDVIITSYIFNLSILALIKIQLQKSDIWYPEIIKEWNVCKNTIILKEWGSNYSSIHGIYLLQSCLFHYQDLYINHYQWKYRITGRPSRESLVTNKTTSFKYQYLKFNQDRNIKTLHYTK